MLGKKLGEGAFGVVYRVSLAKNPASKVHTTCLMEILCQSFVDFVVLVLFARSEVTLLLLLGKKLHMIMHKFRGKTRIFHPGGTNLCPSTHSMMDCRDWDMCRIDV